MSTQIYGYGNSEKRFFLFECFKVSIKESLGSGDFTDEFYPRSKELI